MKYQYILFDLDGTLTDPGVGITRSVQYALEKFNMKVSDLTSLYCFIGPPLIDSFMTFYQLSKEDATLAINYYREYFSVKGMFENEVYDQIVDMLAELKRRDMKVILATSKPEFFAKQILDYFHLTPYFDFVAGSTMDETRNKKADVIQYALDTCQITQKEKVLMVGDREHDVIGAKTCGIDCVGVLYGYGNREELEAAGATYIVPSVAKLRELLGS